MDPVSRLMSGSDLRAIARNAKEDVQLKRCITTLNRERDYQRKLLELDIRVTRNKFGHFKDRLQRFKPSVCTRITPEHCFATRVRNSGIIQDTKHMSPSNRTMIKTIPRVKSSMKSDLSKYVDNSRIESDNVSNYASGREVGNDNSNDSIETLSLKTLDLKVKGFLKPYEHASSKENSVSIHCTVGNNEKTNVDKPNDKKSKSVTFKVEPQQRKFLFKRRIGRELHSSPLLARKLLSKRRSEIVQGVREKKQEFALSENVQKKLENIVKCDATENVLFNKQNIDEKKSSFNTLSREIIEVKNKKLTRRSNSVPHIDISQMCSEVGRNTVADVDRIVNYISTRLPLITETVAADSQSPHVDTETDLGQVNDVEVGSENLKTGDIKAWNNDVKNPNPYEQHKIVNIEEEQSELNDVSVELGPFEDIPFARSRSNTAYCISKAMWKNIEDDFQSNHKNDLFKALLGKKTIFGGLTEAELENLKHCRYLRLPKYLEGASETADPRDIFRKPECDVMPIEQKEP